MDIYLIRHTSVDVPAGTCYGQTDVPLKPSFEAEAATVKKELDRYAFDAIYTSPLSRCTRLAAYCGYPEALRDDRLKEIHMGDWEMQRFDAITDPRMQEWYDDYLHVATTNGESYQELFGRVASFLDEVRRLPFERIAVFTHGGVLMSARIYAEALPPEEALRNLTPYGGIVRIKL